MGEEPAEVISAVARAHLTLASRAKTRATVTEIAMQATAHVASVGSKRRARRIAINRAYRAMRCSARTHAARALIWATSPTTLTNASQRAIDRKSVV